MVLHNCVYLHCNQKQEIMFLLKSELVVGGVYFVDMIHETHMILVLGNSEGEKLPVIKAVYSNELAHRQARFESDRVENIKAELDNEYHISPTRRPYIHSEKRDFFEGALLKYFTEQEVVRTKMKLNTI